MLSLGKLIPHGPHRVNWLLALPKVGTVLLLIAVLSLLWLLHRNELEEERTALIKDVLWLEQNLRFHLNGHEEQLQQLAIDLAEPATRQKLFRPRIANLMRNNSDLKQVLLLDAGRHTIDALPSATPPEQGSDATGRAAMQQAYEMASRLGKRTFSPAFKVGSNKAYFGVVVPVYRGQRLDGLLVGLYAIDALLDQQVPWWFTEKYQVQVLDDNDALFGSKSNVQGTETQSYEFPFEPPGNGLKLRVISYQSKTNPLQRILAGVIIVLAGGVFWSLWAVRDLMKKRARAEEALRSEHAFRKAMEDSLTVGMRARDLSGRIIYVNPAFCQMTGFSSEELVDCTPPMPYWVPEQIEETFAVHLAVMAGEAPPDGFEITLMRKNGERFQALIYEAPLIDGNGQHTGWMGSVLDITERKRADELARQQHEKLQFTSRLVTMGEMASTLAHELNQPLAAIASYNAGCINLLETDNFEPSEIRYALEKVGVQAQRAGRIIRRVHDFVRKSEPKRAPCLIQEVVDDCLGFIEADARKRQIRIEHHIADLPPIMADRLMLEQVLLNLMRNGMDAMADVAPELRLLTLSAVAGNNEITIRVADNGCGIADAVKEKLFTAFFTTKLEGMGVGLSICRSIIEFHRGRLWADPNLDSPTGSGTLFVFTLPLESA